MRILPYRLVSDWASEQQRARLRGVLFRLNKTLNLSQAGAVAWLLWLTTTTGDLSAARLNTSVNRGRKELGDFIRAFTKAIKLNGAGMSQILIGENGTVGIIVLADGQYHKWQLTDTIEEQSYYSFSEADIRGFSELMSKKIHSARMN